MLRRRLTWLFLAVSPALALEAASCSDADVAPTTEDASGIPLVPVDASRRDSAPEDAAPPPIVRKPPTLPACVGSSIPLVKAGEKSYVKVPMTAPDGGAPTADAGPGDASTAASVGDFLVDFGANGSTIDLKGFLLTPPPTPAICYGDPSIPGATCYFDYFDFFGPWGRVGLVTGDYGVLFSTVRQSGIIGTDFLSNYPFTLDYENGRIHRGSATAFCSDAQLLAAGFSPIPMGGFYTNDARKLRPLSEVIAAPDAATTANFTVPNVPTVPISIGGIAALAQIDSGYDDRVTRHSMNINQALLLQIQLKDRTLISREPDQDLFLTTCAGVNQKAEAWVLRKGVAVDFIGEGGIVGRRDEGNVIFVKERSPESDKCGGIDTWTVPAAQLGASFLVDAFAVVFDPLSSRMWIPK